MSKAGTWLCPGTTTTAHIEVFLQHATLHSASLSFPCCFPSLSPFPAARQPVVSSVLSFPRQLLQWVLKYFPPVLKYFAPASGLPAHCFPLSHRGSLCSQPSLSTCSLGWGRAGHLLFGSSPFKDFFLSSLVQDFQFNHTYLQTYFYPSI